jgi:hypothetical protein
MINVYRVRSVHVAAVNSCALQTLIYALAVVTFAILQQHTTYPDSTQQVTAVRAHYTL